MGGFTTYFHGHGLYWDLGLGLFRRSLLLRVVSDNFSLVGNFSLVW